MDDVLRLSVLATTREMVKEREDLAPVIQRVLCIPTDVEEHVQAALMLATLETFDHRSWPTSINELKWAMQQFIFRSCESECVDGHQRRNYMSLLMASKGRHLDVAYGLSERLVWGQKQNVVEKLMDMGKRNYHAPVPTKHVMENGVLHVAVSYKHTSSYYDQGTISEQQAHAIWMAVNAMFFVEEDTEVRVWVDQNLHRSQFPADRKWHEFGLIPYVCLKTVFVGDGDISLRLVRTRPWLWVEMIAALNTDGIHTKPGQDIAAISDGALQPLENYDKMKLAILQDGWLIGSTSDVDECMNRITRTISLWRLELLEHRHYEWAQEFQEFVNWCRRFVIRNVPYSEMEWNHSSEPVCGMDAVAFLRALPYATFNADTTGFVKPLLYWNVQKRHKDWVVDDIIDRSLVGELPLCELLEVEKEENQRGEELRMYGIYGRERIIAFRKQDKVVSMVFRKWDRKSRFESQYSRSLDEAFRACQIGTKKVVLTLSGSCTPLINYKPFTLRISAGRHGKFATGNACLRPVFLSPSVEDLLELQKIGMCYNFGICEQVYMIELDGVKVLLSAHEVNVVLLACKRDIRRFREMAKSLKTFSSYKLTKYKDMSEKELVRCTRGRRISDLKGEHLNSLRFVSGEVTEDVENEIVSTLRSNHLDCTLVKIDRISARNVRVVFRGSHHITALLAPPLGTNMELAILRETNYERLVNSVSTGLIEMAVGMQPEIKVKAYGSGLNPAVRTDEDGKEIVLFGVDGLFSSCDLCGRPFCTLNGLVASVREESNLIVVEWGGKHTCVGHSYENLVLTTGSRIV